MKRSSAGKGALSRMAGEMRTVLEQQPNGWVHRRLNGGLQIVLQRNAAQWRLAIARQHEFGSRDIRVIYPSDVEANVCAQAFDVPVGSEPERKTKSGSKALGGRRPLYGLIEWNWLETEE